MLRSAIAMAAVTLTAGLAPAAVVTKVIDYEHDGTKLKLSRGYHERIATLLKGAL